VDRVNNIISYEERESRGEKGTGFYEWWNIPFPSYIPCLNMETVNKSQRLKFTWLKSPSPLFLRMYVCMFIWSMYTYLSSTTITMEISLMNN
jgi:hypothetical protein